MILHFPLVAPPSLKFKSTIHSFHSLPNFNHFNFIKVKMAYMRVEPTTRLLLLATTKHSTTNDTIIYKTESQG
jgi:hypothetical protein